MTTIGFDATAAVHQAAGIGRYTRQLLPALAARDEFSYRLFWSGPGRRAGKAVALGGRVRGRSVPVSDRFLNLVWHRARLPVPVQLLTGSFNLYHSPDFTLPPTLGKPGVLTVHDLAFLTVPECAYPTLRAYLSVVVPRSVRRARRIIAVSENTRRDLIDLLGVAPECVCTVHEGVGPEFRVSAGDLSDRDSLQALGLSLPYILSVGTLEPRKNYPRLLQAYARLRERGVTSRLVIAGGAGWMDEPIHRRIAELDLAPHVSIVQPTDSQLPALYRLADVFVYPSLYEGFGIPPLEALASGVPVVCSNTSSMPEIVGDAALTIDPRAVEEIAGAIERILSDGALRERLVRAGVQRAASFTWERAAAGTAAVYREALADA